MMVKYHWWLASAISSAMMLGVAAASGLVALAHRFVAELSCPGVPLDGADLLWDGWERPDPELEPPACMQRRLSFRASGGPCLCGDFWAQPQPAPTIVICHGYRVDRTHLRAVAALEYAHGYNILLFDFRGHGESEHAIISGGNVEVHDLEAALDVAAQQPETLPGKVLIHGFSMGAAVALLTRPRPEVAAIVADSPYARLDEILVQLVSRKLAMAGATWGRPFCYLRAGFPALARATVVVSEIIFRLRYRCALCMRPDSSFRRWEHVQRARYIPVLLIHARHDPLISIEHARRIAIAAQASHIPLETYFVDSDSHCGAYRYDPQGYIAALKGFIARYVRCF
jgi:pimeloyl-ACP methyl ester carboxylesterase